MRGAASAALALLLTTGLGASTAQGVPFVTPRSAGISVDVQVVTDPGGPSEATTRDDDLQSQIESVDPLAAAAEARADNGAGFLRSTADASASWTSPSQGSIAFDFELQAVSPEPPGLIEINAAIARPGTEFSYQFDTDQPGRLVVDYGIGDFLELDLVLDGGFTPIRRGSGTIVLDLPSAGAHLFGVRVSGFSLIAASDVLLGDEARLAWSVIPEPSTGLLLGAGLLVLGRPPASGRRRRAAGDGRQQRRRTV